MIKYLKEDFHKEIEKDFIIVDFYADWCGPCRALGEVLETIEDDCLKVNVDEYPEIAREYGIMSIPTVIIMKNGNEIAKNIGFLPKDEFISWINEHR